MREIVGKEIAQIKPRRSARWTLAVQQTFHAHPE